MNTTTPIPIYKSPAVVSITTNLSLIIGNLLQWWDFGATMVTYIYEMALFIVIAAIYYLPLKRQGNPGMILIAGFFIVFMTWLMTAFLVMQGDDNQDGLLNLFTYLRNTTEIWPVLFFLTISTIITFFDINKSERENGIQGILFRKIFLVILIIALGSIAAYFSTDSLLILLALIVILAKTCLDYLIEPEPFKQLLRRFKLTKNK